MGRDEKFYRRGDVLYMAGGTIAAIGDALGHRWARYLDKDFWEYDVIYPEVAEARTEWLREAHKLIKEHNWKEFDRLLEKGIKELPELGSGPFYLKDKSPEEIYDLVAVINHAASPQSTYLDLVMHIDPMFRRMMDTWLDWDRSSGGRHTIKEPPPPPFSDEARRALEEGALGFLIKQTYMPDDIPGIDRPNVTVKYTKQYEEYGGWSYRGRPPIPHTNTVEPNIERLHYEHTTGTGRGEFSVSYEYGVYDFHFRVVRGGAYAGLTAIETHVRIVDEDLHQGEIPNGIPYQITPLAEERHYIYAVDTLSDIAKSMEKYAINQRYVLNVPYEINPAIKGIESLIEIIKHEYEVNFGRYPEEGEYDF